MEDEAKAVTYLVLPTDWDDGHSYPMTWEAMADGYTRACNWGQARRSSAVKDITRQLAKMESGALTWEELPDDAQFIGGQFSGCRWVEADRYDRLVGEWDDAMAEATKLEAVRQSSEGNDAILADEWWAVGALGRSTFAEGEGDGPDGVDVEDWVDRQGGMSFVEFHWRCPTTARGLGDPESSEDGWQVSHTRSAAVVGWASTHSRPGRDSEVLRYTRYVYGAAHRSSKILWARTETIAETIFEFAKRIDREAFVRGGVQLRWAEGWTEERFTAEWDEFYAVTERTVQQEVDGY